MMTEKLNFDKVWAALMENREQMKESQERWEKRFQETVREMKESSMAVDRVVEKVSQQLGNNIEKVSQQLGYNVEKVSQQLGYIGNNNGSVAEEYFYNSFAREKNFANQHFDFIERNKDISNGKRHAEFDIVMYNGKSIAIIEVKYKVHTSDIQKVLDQKEQFRKMVSYSQGKEIYLGIAGLSFPREVETATLKAGIAVIKQVGDTVVVQDERVKKF